MLPILILPRLLGDPDASGAQRGMFAELAALLGQPGARERATPGASF
jgi:hypothetical protein